MFSTSKLAVNLAIAIFVSANTQALHADHHKQSKPNIVFILADDLGYGDLKSYNSQSKIATPNLDELAKAGIIFTDAHSGGSTCRPSRYSLLTGRFAARKESFNDRNGPLIQDGRATIASLLQDNGYQTAMVGKWHLGFHELVKQQKDSDQVHSTDYTKPLTGGPLDRGFDSFYGMHASLDIPPYFYIKNRKAVKVPSQVVKASTSVGDDEGWNNIQGKFWREGNISPDFVHEEVTSRFADKASSVIESYDGKKPLFLYLALPSPHTPWLPLKQFIGKSEAGMYGDFVMQVDSVVGQVLSSLEKAGIADNTIVMFSSDNGPVWYEKDVEKFDHRSVGALRGVKGSVWEGGHRVPFIVKWSGHIKQGSESNHTIAFADVFATFAEVSGKTQAPKTMAEDSESFAQVMLSPEKKQKPRSAILHGGRTIRDGDWKLINTKGSRGFGSPKTQYGIELYNLKDDISETNNLAEEMPEKVESMKLQLREVLEKE